MWRVLPVLAAVFALAVPAAGAAVRVPAGAKVVAGPTPSGARLLAFERRDEVCVVIRFARATVDDVRCAGPPARASSSFALYGDDGAGLAAHAGMVPPEVARVRLRFAVDVRGEDVERDELVEADTTAPSVAGVRFWLAEGPSQTPWLTTYAGADGTALAAHSDFPEGPVVAPPTALARGSGGSRMVAVTRLKHAGTPLDLGRVIRETCLSVVAGSDWSGGPCTSDDAPIPARIEASPTQHCSGTTIAVTAGGGVVRLVAVLGTGRRVAVPLVGLRDELAAFGSHAGALTVRGPTAVRRLEGFGADGRLVKVLSLGVAPPDRCGRGVSMGGSGQAIVTFVSNSGRRGPLRASARDAGARLCFTLGEFDPRQRDCALPPLEAAYTYLDVRRSGGRALVAGVLPAEVAFVDLDVDGLIRRLPTTGDLPGYGGQYRDRVRFFAVELPASSFVRAGRLLASSGRILNRAAVFDTLEPRTLATRRVHMNGGVVRVERRSSDRDRFTPDVCVRMNGFCQPMFSPMAFVEARCGPRPRVVVAGAAPGRIRIRTDRGTVVPRTLVVAGTPMFAAVLPPGARATVIVAGRHRARLDLPAAVEQCGYSDFADLSEP